MRLIEDLRARLETECSYFRQHLIREDIARLERIARSFEEADGEAAFIEAALLVGWTPGDLRTFELKTTLVPLLAAIHARLQAVAGSEDTASPDDEIARRWSAFDADRLDRLVGCLASVPRPVR